jgi:hypothetical protein
MPMRCTRILRTAPGCSAVSSIPPPVLTLRNSGPALRLATACQASNARSGQVSRQAAAGQGDLSPPAPPDWFFRA